jgi:D-xylonolactonase
MNSALEIVAQDNNRCGEGPIWDPARRVLIWNDLSASLVFQHVPATRETTIISRGLMVSGIALNRTGDLVFAGAGGLYLWQRPRHLLPIVSEYQGQRLCFNDIIADPKGRVYAGTYCWTADGMERTGHLWLIDPTGTCRIVDEGIELANGLGFSSDNHTLYLADTAARTIYAYDVNASTGSLSGKRVFVRVPDEDGIPDGLTVDRDDFLWCAMWYGGQVVRYGPDGAVEQRIRMPVLQVSSIAFGGEDLQDLYITTAAEPWVSRLAPRGFDAGASNMGGSLYRVRVEVPGKPEHLAAFQWP